MKQLLRRCRLVGLVASLAMLQGCDNHKHYLRDEAVTHYKDVATEIAYPDVDQAPSAAAVESRPPRRIADPEDAEMWDLTLEEAIGATLRTSTVLRDLGGRVVDFPESTPTVFDPAIRESDPRIGVEAALSAFDANLVSGITWSRNDRPLNNSFFAGGIPTGRPTLLQEDLANFNVGLQKITAAGTQVGIRNTVDYRLNNVGVPPNVFGSVNNTSLEFAIQQPLLQGAGVAFNRIAGPQATPGFFFSNGVLIARINTDVALAEFEAEVRDLVASVEDTYWELYFAYRNLDTLAKARDSALETWRVVKTKLELGAADRTEESQVREQYFTFRAEAEAALGGTGSENDPNGGLYGLEAKLRRLMGLPVNDGRLLRPIDEPAAAPILFDWDSVVRGALAQRVELRQQRWRIKQRELELVAAKNFLLPRLDFGAQYRINGFGDHLIRSESDNPRFNNAFETLADGDFTDWQLGLQLNMPVGFRRAWTAVRNAELRLAQSRAILADQELAISHALGQAIRDVDAAYTQTQTNYNRLLAGQEHEQRANDRFVAGASGSIDLLLEAQERRARAERAYYRSLMDYNRALKQVELEKGTLLAQNSVVLSEGGWPAKAYHDAYERARARSNAREVDIGITEPEHFAHAGRETAVETVVEVSETAAPSSAEQPPATVVQTSATAADGAAEVAAPNPGTVVKPSAALESNPPATSPQWRSR